MRFSVSAAARSWLTPVPFLLFSACFGFWTQFIRRSDSWIDVHLLASDLLVWPLLAMALLRREARNRLRAVRIPAPLWLLAGVTILAASIQGGFRGVADSVQAMEYLVLFAALFALDSRGLDRLPVLLCAVSALVCGVALVQFLQHPQQPIAVASLYENRNVFGCVLTVLIPVVMAAAMSSKARRARALGIAILVVALFVTTAWQALLAFAVAGAVMAAIFPAHRRGWAAFCCLAAVALWSRAGDGAALEPRAVTAYTNRLERRALMTRKQVLLQRTVGTSRIAMLTPRPPSLGLNDDCLRMIETWNRTRVFGDGHHLSQEVIEWNAGLGMFATAPVLGFGPGNYQRFVSSFYGAAPKLNSMEPDAQSGVLVQGATTGVIGIALLVLAAGTSIGLAWRHRGQGMLEVTVAGNVGFLAGACFLPVPQRAESLVFLVALVVRDAMRASAGANIETARVPVPAAVAETSAPPGVQHAGPRKSKRLATSAATVSRAPSVATLVILVVAIAALVAAPLLLRESMPLTPDIAAARVPGAAIQALIGLICLAVAWRQTSPRVLQATAALLLAWLVAALAPATLHFAWSGVQISVRPVLAPLLLLVAAAMVAPGSKDTLLAPSRLLGTAFAVLLAGIGASVLLWLWMRGFYRTDAASLTARIWPLAAAGLALRASCSLAGNVARARALIIATSLGVLLLTLVPLIRAR